MDVSFPEPTDFTTSTPDVFLRYLDYLRSRIDAKLSGLDDVALRAQLVPSGWSPIELLKHLVCMERRWIVWGFEGEQLTDQWADLRDNRWFVDNIESLESLLDELHVGAERTRRVVASVPLSQVGQPGERWNGNQPATLERVLFHVFMEYSRHLGQLDVVRELIDGFTGE